MAQVYAADVASVWPPFFFFGGGGAGGRLGAGSPWLGQPLNLKRKRRERERDTYTCMYVCMYVCINLCMYIYVETDTRVNA